MIVLITGTGRPFQRLVAAGVALSASGREVWIQHGTAELPPGVGGRRSCLTPRCESGSGPRMPSCATAVQEPLLMPLRPVTFRS